MNWLKVAVIIGLLFSLAGCSEKVELETDNVEIAIESIELTTDSVEIYEGQKFVALDYLEESSKTKSDLKIENNTDTDKAGTYQVTYTIGKSEKKLEVIVKEDPVTLLETNIIIELGSDFDPSRYISDDDKQNEIIIESNVKKEIEGAYTVKYSFMGIEKILNVEVKKVTLALKDENVSIGYKTSFNAKDYIDSNFLDSNRIKIDNQVDTSKLGTYKVVYSVDKEKYVLNVVVKDVSPILLKNSIIISKGSIFNPKEYLIDEDQRNTEIEIIDLVNTSIAGVYTVTYTLGSIIKMLEVTVKEDPVVVVPFFSATPNYNEDNIQSNEASIQIVSFNSPISAGSTAKLKIKGSPNTMYTIRVKYKSGVSKAAGLDSKKSDNEGYVQWSWKVGSKTSPGDWSVEIESDEDYMETFITVK